MSLIPAHGCDGTVRPIAVPRVVAISEIPTPYRLPLYERVAARGLVDLHVLFCSDEQPNRPWRLARALERVPHEFLPGVGIRFGRKRNTFVYEINPSVVRALRRARPDVLVIGGYSVFSEQAAIAYARIARVPYLIHSESHLAKPRSALKRAAKQLVLPTIVGGAAGGLAVGSAAARYLAAYGVPRERIRIVPNAIDTPAYRARAKQVRADAGAIRATYGLPERYWLFAGRLVEVKGLTDLLAAVARLADPPPVLVAGDGPLRSAVAATEGFRLLGFQQSDRLLELMALAELTIVPSRIEPWGVVVNEALAAGSPVIATVAVGAAEDLIEDGVNGRIVATGDPIALAAALTAPIPTGTDRPGRVDEWDIDFAVRSFEAGVSLARGA